jgi:predicted LPLAT superfamily acyltransferase
MEKTQKPENVSLHWSHHKEQAAGYWNVKFMLVLFRLFPVVVLRVLTFPVGFFYFLFSKKGRTESKRFLHIVAHCINNSKTAKQCRSFWGPLRHIISFSLTLVEKLETWSGKFRFEAIYFQNDDIGELISDMENGKGVFLVTSHLGNIELLRGLASFNRTGVSKRVPMTAIVDRKVTGNFNRMLKELNPQSSLDIIGAEEIGPGTAALLEEKLAAGEIVTIAGDRTSANAADNSIMISFLGKDAPFSPGAFYLTVLMRVPVYFIFALRRGDMSLNVKYDMHVHKSSLSFDCTKKERLERSSELARSYTALLESYCKEKPFQWYNFYDFWSKGV